ncbi:hypothetical protein Tco_0963315 [Tanacetum coccineum]
MTRLATTVNQRLTTVDRWLTSGPTVVDRWSGGSPASLTGGPTVDPVTAGKPRGTTQVVTRGILMIANHMLQVTDMSADMSVLGVCQYEVRVQGIRANDWRGD